MLYVRGHDISEAEHAIGFDKRSCRWTLLGAASDVHISPDKQILDVLGAANKPLSTKEIASKTGIPRNDVDQLLRKMGQDGAVDKAASGKCRPSDDDSRDHP